jgi:hypothetical protein
MVSILYTAGFNTLHCWFQYSTLLVSILYTDGFNNLHCWFQYSTLLVSIIYTAGFNTLYCWFQGAHLMRLVLWITQQSSLPEATLMAHDATLPKGNSHVKMVSVWAFWKPAVMKGYYVWYIVLPVRTSHSPWYTSRRLHVRYQTHWSNCKHICKVNTFEVKIKPQIIMYHNFFLIVIIGIPITDILYILQC